MKNKIFLSILIIVVVFITTSCNILDNKESETDSSMKIYIKVNNHVMEAELFNNSSSTELYKKLENDNIIVNMSDYGNFEKVGNLGFSLPTNDEPITTKPGDIILYQGNKITIYYDKNNWNFTKLGEIKNTSKEELLKILGNSDVIVEFSLNQ